MAVRRVITSLVCQVVNSAAHTAIQRRYSRRHDPGGSPMSGQLIAVMAGLIFCHALIARVLSSAGLTAPMLSVAAGLVFFATSSVDINADFVHALAEITLVIILFHDASTVRLNQLRHDPGIALRLLVIGFPLALLATFLVRPPFSIRLCHCG